jgi:hypothetical protein
MMCGSGVGDVWAERSPAQDQSSMPAMVVPRIQSTEAILLLSTAGKVLAA